HTPSTTPVNPLTRQPCATSAPSASGRTNSHGGGAVAVAGASVALSATGAVGVVSTDDAEMDSDAGGAVIARASSLSGRAGSGATPRAPAIFVRPPAAHATAAPAAPAASLPTNARRDSIPYPPSRIDDHLRYHKVMQQVKKTPLRKTQRLW